MGRERRSHEITRAEFAMRRAKVAFSRAAAAALAGSPDAVQLCHKALDDVAEARAELKRLTDGG